MEWSDEALLLSARQHGETAALVEVFSRLHGRHLGLVHGGQSRQKRPVLQTGNLIDVVWKARLSEQLGYLTVDLRKGYAASAMDDPRPLAALASMTSLIRLLPERDPHPNLYEMTMFVLGFLDDPSVWPALVVRWEIGLLDELGYGLDLTQCAATGANDNLIYVSPRTGRAVSASAGEPYHDRLLPLPRFLVGRVDGTGVDSREIIDGLSLTQHFLETRVLAPRELSLPEPRVRLANLLSRPSPARKDA